MPLHSRRKISAGEGNRNFDLTKKIDALEMFRTFYKEFQEREFTEEEEEYMKKIWADLQKEEL